MTGLGDKFSRVLNRLKSERGAVALFGLFQREDSPDDGFDLVISASWLNDAGLDELRYLAQVLGDELEPDEMLLLSRIVPMDTDDESVRWIGDWLKSQSSFPVRLVDFDFAGARIKSAAIIASAVDGKRGKAKAQPTRL